MSIKHFLQRVDQVNLFAELEGWAIFDADDGCANIQRDDEAGTFSSDNAALRHVKRLAKSGSALHRMALEMTSDNRRV